MNRKLTVIPVLAVVIVAGVYLWRGTRGASTSPTSPGETAKQPPRRSSNDRKRVPLPPRGSPDAKRPIVAERPPRGRLVTLFDTGNACEQHNATHCEALRAAAERCDSGDAAGCRAALQHVDEGRLRDIVFATVFAKRLCETGGDCERARVLEQYRNARSDAKAHEAAVAACAAGDAAGCAFAAEATEDEGESLRYSKLACQRGVIAAGGCFSVALAARGTQAEMLALEHACNSDSADGCDLLGRAAYERGELDGARTALSRACELAPGGDGCVALDALDSTGSP